MAPRRIHLVSCVSLKRASPAPAKELYISEWFTKARRLVEASGEPWFILSAEHGLLAPDTIIPPYNRTLNTMTVNDRRAWADRVKSQMLEALPKADELVILAGQKYRENLISWLEQRFARVSVPMQGLPIGLQLSWMKNAETL